MSRQPRRTTACAVDAPTAASQARRCSGLSGAAYRGCQFLWDDHDALAGGRETSVGTVHACVPARLASLDSILEAEVQCSRGRPIGPTLSANPADAQIGGIGVDPSCQHVTFKKFEATSRSAAFQTGIFQAKTLQEKKGGSLAGPSEQAACRRATPSMSPVSQPAGQHKSSPADCPDSDSTAEQQGRAKRDTHTAKPTNTKAFGNHAPRLDLFGGSQTQSMPFLRRSCAEKEKRSRPIR
ncbi:hypothetical protein L1887_55086 [Cichorium endivia]|nr:hypothetical protein L1887_55086 [Cichorium endivia]